MLHPTPDHWRKLNIQSDCHKFFYLRWQELFDQSTFDSWQVRSSNIRSMIDELEKILQQADSTKYKKNLHMLSMLLGIKLRNLGFSIEELRNSSAFLENSSYLNFMDRFQKLRQRFSDSTTVYYCYVLIRGPGSFDGIQHENITVIHRTAEQDIEKQKFWQQDNDDAVSALACRIVAQDSYAARRQAIQMIESILAYWRIYRPSREHTVHPGVLVITGQSKMYEMFGETANLFLF